MAQRADSGLWELPGGKQEPGESLELCLERELAEELGIRVRVRNLLGTAPGKAKNGAPFKLHCYMCNIINGIPLAHEHRKITWVTLEQALGYELCSSDRELLSGLCANGKM